jgi:hypothetical protein
LIKLALIGVSLACQLVDLQFTNWRISNFALAVEENPLVRKAVERLGKRGIYLGLAPGFVVPFLAALLGVVPLALLTGAKLKLAYDQIRSRKFHEILLELRGQRDAQPPLPSVPV